MSRAPESPARVVEGKPVHTDHPSRHWDRTCPACLAEGQPDTESPAQEQPGEQETMRRTFERSIHEREAKDSLTIKTNAAPQALGKQNDVPPPLADSNLSLPAVAAPVAPAEVVKAEIQKQQAEHAPVPATTEVKATPVAAAIAEVKAARRGRADKGHKRGEYKPRETNAAPQAVLAGSEAPQTASSHRPTAEPAVAAKDEP